MKIAFHIDSPPCRPTGIGRYTGELLKALQRRGMDVESWIRWRWKNHASELCRGTLIRPLLSTGDFSDLLLPAVYSSMKGIRIIHSPNGNLLPFTGKACQTVMIHDLALHIFQDLKPAEEVKHWKKKIAAAVKHADGILVNSATTAADLEHFFPGSSSKTFITRLGIDHLKRKPKGSGRGKHILAVGTVEPRKNYVKLFASYRKLRLQSRSTPPLLIAGGMGYRSDEIRTCAGEGVHFTGYVSEKRLHELYRDALLLVNPALYEGFGFSVPEAMKFGLPVVCSSTSALGELFGEASYQVNPENIDSITEGITQALEKGLTPSMKASSEKLFRTLSWNNCAEATERAFRALL